MKTQNKLNKLMENENILTVCDVPLMRYRVRNILDTQTQSYV